MLESPAKKILENGQGKELPGKFLDEEIVFGDAPSGDAWDYYRKKFGDEPIIDPVTGFPIPKKIEEVEKAYGEALRDNEDYNNRNTPEYKENQKRLREVIKAMNEKRDSPESAKNIKIALVLLGGGFRAGSTFGQTQALTDMGYNKGTFDRMIATSSGTLAALSFMGDSKIAKKTAEMLCKHISDPEVLGARKTSNFLDINYIAKLLADGRIPLDIEGVMQNPAELDFVYTNRETGLAEMVNAKKYSNGELKTVAGMVETSMYIPLMTKKPPEIAKHNYMDGAFANLPMEEMMRGGITHMLVMPQIPYYKWPPSRAKEMMALVAEQMRPSLITAFAHKLVNGNSLAIDQINHAKEKFGITAAVLYPTEADLSLLNNKADLKSAIVDAAVDTFKQMGYPEMVNKFKLE